MKFLLQILLIPTVSFSQISDTIKTKTDKILGMYYADGKISDKHYRAFKKLISKRTDELFTRIDTTSCDYLIFQEDYDMKKNKYGWTHEDYIENNKIKYWFTNGNNNSHAIDDRKDGYGFAISLLNDSVEGGVDTIFPSDFVYDLGCIRYPSKHQEKIVRNQERKEKKHGGYIEPYVAIDTVINYKSGKTKIVFYFPVRRIRKFSFWTSGF